MESSVESDHQELVPLNAEQQNRSDGEVDEPEPPFPNEIWQHILANLSVKELLPVRLTCRRLKDLVDNNPRTLNEFMVYFPVGTKMDESYKPEHLFMARRVKIPCADIITVDSWWPSLAERLHEIYLTRCYVPLATLTGMLRETVNLKCLTLTYIDAESVDDSVLNVDFELIKLEKLKLITYPDVLSLLEQICKRLKEVWFKNCPNEWIVKLIRASQNTLEAVSIHDFRQLPNVLSEMSRMEQLHLKRACFYWEHINRNELCEFSRAQPALKELVLTAIEQPFISQTFELIIQYFSNLHRCDIEVNKSCEELPAFFTVMKNLKHLVVSYRFNDDVVQFSSYKVDFSNCSSPNLKSLKIVSNKSVFLKNFSHILDSCPNLTSLHLFKCRIPEWSDIFTQKRLKFLRSLHLVNVVAWKRGHLEKLDNLKYLNLTTNGMCYSTYFRLVDMIGTCIELEELSLAGVDYFTDSMVLKMCAKFKRLSKLSIKSSSITAATAEKIKELCSSLRQLEIN